MPQLRRSDGDTVCRLCGFVLPLRSMGRHLKARHLTDIVEYKLQVERRGEWPTCACGCGQDVKYGRNGDFHRMAGMHRGGSRYTVAMRRVWREMSPTARRRRGRNIGRSMLSVMRGGGVKWATGHYTSAKTGRTVAFKSSWELRHLVDLDADPSVATFDYEPHAVQYVYRRRRHLYFPDFRVRYVDGRTEYHEVGPAGVKGRGRSGAKLEAMREWCRAQGFGFRVVDFTVSRHRLWGNWEPTV